MIDKLADESVEAIGIIAIASVALGAEASAVTVGGIVAIAGGRRAVKGLSALAK